jgi:hypothetical protein
MASLIKARGRRMGLPFGSATDYDLPVSRSERRRAGRRRDDEPTDPSAALFLRVLPGVGDAMRTAWRVAPAALAAVALLVAAHSAVDAGRDGDRTGRAVAHEEPVATGSIR